MTFNALLAALKFPLSPLIYFWVIFSVGFKSKVDTSSIFGTNRRITVEEMEEKLEQYKKNAELVKISNQYKKKQV